MAKICEGMSGREISKLGVSWQAAVYASEDGVLTEKMVLDKAEAAAAQHKQKVGLKQLKIKKSLNSLYFFSIFRWPGYQNRNVWITNLLPVAKDNKILPIP